MTGACAPFLPFGRSPVEPDTRCPARDSSGGMPRARLFVRRLNSRVTPELQPHCLVSPGAARPKASLSSHGRDCFDVGVPHGRVSPSRHSRTFRPLSPSGPSRPPERSLPGRDFPFQFNAAIRHPDRSVRWSNPCGSRMVAPSTPLVHPAGACTRRTTEKPCRLPIRDVGGPPFFHGFLS